VSHPIVRVTCTDQSCNYVEDVNTLTWVPMTQPGGSTGGGGDASAANQTTEIAKLTSIDGKLTAPLSVTGTFWQATQPVSGTVAVSNLPATQPVSGTVTANAGTGTFTVSGTVTANVGTGTQPVSGTVAVSNFPATQPVSGTVTVQHGLTGATNVMKTGTITTTATTADQVVLTYTVTSGKTLFLQYLVMYGRLTTLSATASILGAISLEAPSGTKAITFDDVNPTTSELEFNPVGFSEPIPLAAGTVVRVVVTPAATTSMLWRANFGGYEK
jgi:hypothetical protein